MTTANTLHPNGLRQPPCDIAAEQNVLGALLLKPESLALVEDWLATGDFYRRDHQQIFAAITALAERHTDPDAVTVADAIAMAGGDSNPAYVLQLANDTASAANVTAYAEIVVEKSRLRKLIAAGTRLVGTAFTSRTPASVAATEAARALTDIAGDPRHGLEPVKPALQALYTQMTDRYAHGAEMLGQPTPWAKLNEWTHGLRDGELVVVGGRPSMGKSVLAGQIAVMTALRGQRTAWFSVEMTAKQCMERAVASIGNIDYAWVQQPSKKGEDADVNWSAVGRAYEALLKSPLLIDDTPGLSIRALMARARRAHLQAPLRMIVIDHLHDMAIDPRQARFDVGEIAQGAKTLAKEFRCPVVLAAQLNRALAQRTDKRPQMSDLRESGDIEQKADVVLFVHRPERYDPKDHPGVVELIAAKSRNLPPHGTIYLRERFDRMRLEDWDGPMPDNAEREQEREGTVAEGLQRRYGHGRKWTQEEPT